MKIAGWDARYDVLLLSYRNLKKLVRRFGVIDYTIEIITQPEKYADSSRGRLRAWVQRWPQWLIRAMLPVIPIHVWVLVKPGAPDGPNAAAFLRRETMGESTP
jgi:hypothetical protein